MSNFNTNAQWRYATKKFDATRKITDADLAKLKEAIRLSASSFGLQPYKVLIIENPEVRAQLQPASWGQSQIVDASHLIVFANSTNLNEADVDAYMETTAATRNVALEDLKGYSDYIKGFVANLPADVKANWTAKQTYIALSNLLNAAAELKIDATPMEGFEPAKYNEILGLTEQGLNASVVAALGYRSEEDGYQHAPKVRKPNEDLFVII